MRDLNEMRAEDFERYHGEDFVITSTEPPVCLTLVEVKKLGAGERAGGAFSLLWQGPADPALGQATYRVSQDEIGAHDIFLVPVAKTKAGFQYEAIFT